MKLIVKGREPKEWKEFRNTAGTDYESKQELRKSLYKEQGGLCAYCMKRLSNEFDRNVLTRNKIDHIKPRESCTRDERMDYNNMVLCCSGTTFGITHCDTHKGSLSHTLSPLNPQFIDSLSYTSRGIIKSSDEIWDRELNAVLNLNHKQLAENRKDTILTIVKWLSSKSPTKAQIEKSIKSYQSRDANGLYQEYCEVAVWRLRKSLRARQ